MEKKDDKYYPIGENKFEILEYEKSFSILNSGLPWIVDLIINSLVTLISIFLRHDPNKTPIIYVLDKNLIDKTFDMPRFQPFGTTNAKYVMVNIKKEKEIFDTFPSDYQKFFYTTLTSLSKGDFAFFYINSYTNNVYIRRLNQTRFTEFCQKMIDIKDNKNGDEEEARTTTEEFINDEYAYRSIYMNIFSIFSKRIFIIEKNYPSCLKIDSKKQYKIRVRIKDTNLSVLLLTFTVDRIIHYCKRKHNHNSDTIATIVEYINSTPITTGIASLLALKCLREECEKKELDFISVNCNDPLNCYYLMNMGFKVNKNEMMNYKFGEFLRVLLFDKEMYKDMPHSIEEIFDEEKKFFIGKDDNLHLMIFTK